MSKMYIYIKNGEIVSNPLVPISKEADRVVELDFDISRSPYTLYLDENGDPVIDYDMTSEDPTDTSSTGTLDT